MSAHLFIKKPMEESEEKHGEAFMTACTGRASQARIDTLYGMLYPPRFQFEDPYTYLGILWTWGIGWHEHIKPRLKNVWALGAEGVLELSEVEWLLSYLDLYTPKPDEAKMAAWGASTKKEHMRLWHKYYGERRKEFKRFIERAIQYESGIDVCLNY